MEKNGANQNNNGPMSMPPVNNGFGSSAPGTNFPAPTNTMAILSLVFAFVFSVLGIVFGIIALNQIKRTGEGGKSIAIAGIVASSVFTVLAILYFVFIIIMFVIAAQNPVYY